MSLALAVRSRLGVKISLALAALLLVLTGVAAVVITARQTQQLEDLTQEKARLAATMAARQWGDMFDNAIDSGLLSVTDVFDTNYVEIKGWDWKGKTKYHTRYDSVTDRAVLVFQDKVLEQNEDFLYAVGLDVNGYVPTHNSRNQRPLEGNDKDLVGNRTKRIFFSNATEVNRAKSTEPYLKQVYHRDTGETLWDVSAPIWVKGRHWGAFVLGVSMQQIEAKQRSLLWVLLALFGAFGVLAMAAMFLIVQRAIRPVAALTEAAEQISMGEGLDTPLEIRSVDEIGKLGKAVERLRVSMKAALERLRS